MVKKIINKIPNSDNKKATVELIKRFEILYLSFETLAKSYLHLIITDYQNLFAQKAENIIAYIKDQDYELYKYLKLNYQRKTIMNTISLSLTNLEIAKKNYMIALEDYNRENKQLLENRQIFDYVTWNYIKVELKDKNKFDQVFNNMHKLFNHLIVLDTEYRKNAPLNKHIVDEIISKTHTSKLHVIKYLSHFEISRENQRLRTKYHEIDHNAFILYTMLNLENENAKEINFYSMSFRPNKTLIKKIKELYIQKYGRLDPAPDIFLLKVESLLLGILKKGNGKPIKKEYNEFLIQFRKQQSSHYHAIGNSEYIEQLVDIYDRCNSAIHFFRDMIDVSGKRFMFSTATILKYLTKIK